MVKRGENAYAGAVAVVAALRRGEAFPGRTEAWIRHQRRVAMLDGALGAELDALGASFSALRHVAYAADAEEQAARAAEARRTATLVRMLQRTAAALRAREAFAGELEELLSRHEQEQGQPAPVPPPGT